MSAQKVIRTIAISETLSGYRFGATMSSSKSDAPFRERTSRVKPDYRISASASSGQDRPA
jgi:hypothetical protein